MKWLLVLVLVLEVPLSIWLQIPTQERDRIRLQATLEHLKESAQLGFTKWVIREEINDWKWQLHIEPIELKL